MYVCTYEDMISVFALLWLRNRLFSALNLKISFKQHKILILTDTQIQSPEKQTNRQMDRQTYRQSYRRINNQKTIHKNV